MSQVRHRQAITLVAVALSVALSVAPAGASAAAHFEPAGDNFESGSVPVSFKLENEGAINCPSMQLPRIVSALDGTVAALKGKVTFPKSCTSQNLGGLVFEGRGTTGWMMHPFASPLAAAFLPREISGQRPLEFVSGTCTLSVPTVAEIKGSWVNGVGGSASALTFSEASVGITASASCPSIVQAASDGKESLFSGSFAFKDITNPGSSIVIN